MNTLIIETSTEACSVALQVDEQRFCFHEVAPMRHNELLTPVVSDLLQQADIQADDLDNVVLGSGPGSFTGIRLAAAFAQGLAMASNAQCLAISSFALHAQGVHDYLKTDRILLCQNAQKGQIYAAAYDLQDDKMLALIEPCLLNPNQLSLPKEGAWSMSGNAWFQLADEMPKWPELMRDRYVLNWLPRAEDGFNCLDLARPLDEQEINYLREASDWKKINQK